MNNQTSAKEPQKIPKHEIYLRIGKISKLDAKILTHVKTVEKLNAERAELLKGIEESPELKNYLSESKAS